MQNPYDTFNIAILQKRVLHTDQIFYDIYLDIHHSISTHVLLPVTIHSYRMKFKVQFKDAKEVCKCNWFSKRNLIVPSKEETRRRIKLPFKLFCQDRFRLPRARKPFWLDFPISLRSALIHGLLVRERRLQTPLPWLSVSSALRTSEEEREPERQR